MVPRPDADSPRGKDTLRVMDGVVVGRYRSDVFVELGERMQGVASLQQFGGDVPKVGDSFEFTLRGQEETLWVLSLAERPVLADWQNMEVGALVEVKIVRGRVGGLEGKVGQLHAFLPKSHTGLPRERKVEELLGQSLVVQVLEVDADKQRLVVSRRAVLKGTDSASRAAREGRLVPGMKVEGRVTRVERYGVFLRFASDLTGLIHRTDLAWGHVADARDLVKKGERLPAVLLTVRHGGKRISLGTKQLVPNPWLALERERDPGDLLTGRVVAVRDWGGQVETAGIVGFVPQSEVRAARGLHGRLQPEEELTLRIVSLDAQLERLSLALRDVQGRALVPDDLVTPDVAPPANFGRGLGSLLRQVLPEPGSTTAASHNESSEEPTP